MTEYSKKDLNYALDAIQDPEIRKSEEFKIWISKAENRNLFIELMAGREAVMREKYLRKYALRKRIKIVSIVSAVAAASLLAIFLPDFFHSTPLPETNRDIRFFYSEHQCKRSYIGGGEQNPGSYKRHFHGNGCFTRGCNQR